MKAPGPKPGGGYFIITTAGGETIKLPQNLESVPRADQFPAQRHRWNTNEEIAAILTSFDRHADWLSKEVKIRPKSGSMLLYSRKKVRYRRDGYCWKKRKDGKTTREDHMKLKVQGTECIYGCYVHSAILPTFHRRCYWLLQNPDIVLVHYLNVPYPDDNKLVLTASISLWGDRKEWTKEELISQLKPMFFSEDEPDLNNELEISTAETVEAIVAQLMEKQRQARQATVQKQLECGCPDSTCADSKTCTHPIRRISAAKSGDSRTGIMNITSVVENNNQVSSTTGSGNLLLGNSSTAVENPSPSSSSKTTTTNNPLPAATNQLPATTNSSTPLVLSLQQIQGGGGLLILNGATGGAITSLVCTQTTTSSSATDHLATIKTEPPEVSAYQQSSDSRPVSSPAIESLHLDVTNGNISIGSNAFSRRSSEKPKASMTSKSTETSSSSLRDIVNRNDLSFFSGALELSQEDIQETLNANMPSCSTDPISQSAEAINDDTSEINPMDFVDTDIRFSPPDDDVFVNLEAFDMLGDFPEFPEVLEPSTTEAATTSTTSTTQESRNSQNQRMDYREGTANITDFSPEWAYPEGGVKVLVTGPWYSSTSPYSILFDSVAVPTTLVQSGVLRCYCPAHEVGLVGLQVACEGFVISNSVIFEYKSHVSEEVPARDTCLGTDWCNDNYLRFTLLQRLQSMEDRMEEKKETYPSTLHRRESLLMFNQRNLEDQLVYYCQDLTYRRWKKVEELPTFSTATFHGMTLLHLAAALGYARLVCALLHWRAENPSATLAAEVDALSQDSEGYTPLMWACSQGHKEVALLLYQWNHTALALRNSGERTALDVARQNKHNDLADEIHKLELERDKSHENDTVKRQDFLKPGVRTRSESRRSTLSISADTNIISSTRSLASVDFTRRRLAKRSSVDSGINLTHGDVIRDRRDTLSVVGREIPKLSRHDRSLSLPLSSQVLHRTCECHSDVFPNPSSPMHCMECFICDDHAESRCESPLIDVEGVSDDEVKDSPTDSLPGRRESISSEMNITDTQDTRVFNLAEQIIAALPERIKNDNGDDPMQQEVESSISVDTASDTGYQDQLMEDMSRFDSEASFEFSDHSYRYCDVGTPSSSMSPASSSCLHSPCSFTLDSPSPPPTTADLSEYFMASGNMFVNDFSNLTLSDQEQRELYEAAKIIQKAYRSYKGRKKAEEQENERVAASIIQNYYRRYKQYAYFRQMTRAAMVIQNQYRMYCEHKRFKKAQEGLGKIRSSSGPEGSSSLKRTYSQRRQHQAARKIQQFMRQSKANFWDFLRNKSIAERTCVSCRKREAPGAGGLTGGPAPPKIPLSSGQQYNTSSHGHPHN